MTNPPEGPQGGEGKWQSFRKRPVDVRAFQWTGHGEREGEVVRYFARPDIAGYQKCKHCGFRMDRHGWIDTLEGGHIVCPMDWIIEGVKGEHYPCKPDIFADTYTEGAAPTGELTKRERWLMQEAYNAGTYIDRSVSNDKPRVSFTDWLDDAISDAGHTVEMALLHELKTSDVAPTGDDCKCNAVSECCRTLRAISGEPEGIEDLLRDVTNYAAHSTSCTWWQDADKCSCGLRAAAQAVMDVAASKGDAGPRAYCWRHDEPPKDGQDFWAEWNGELYQAVWAGVAAGAHQIGDGQGKLRNYWAAVSRDTKLVNAKVVLFEPDELPEAWTYITLEGVAPSGDHGVTREKLEKAIEAREKAHSKYDRACAQLYRSPDSFSTSNLAGQMKTSGQELRDVIDQIFSGDRETEIQHGRVGMDWQAPALMGEPPTREEINAGIDAREAAFAAWYYVPVGGDASDARKRYDTCRAELSETLARLPLGQQGDTKP